MSSTLIPVLIGGLLGSTTTLVGTLLSHRLTRDRDRRNVALQGPRELAVVGLRAQQRDETEFEADLATLEYQWTVAGVSRSVTSEYIEVARYRATQTRAGRSLDHNQWCLLLKLDELVKLELLRPARGRSRKRRNERAVMLAESITTSPE
jgi:hypothetical protein